ncbi:hypothetical protein B0H12DRAFT_855321 [Mycena haematopus]|nr:hypothetical protein B0H12DRAFT_855321 [Mycena haematopus]
MHISLAFLLYLLPLLSAAPSQISESTTQPVVSNTGISASVDGVSSVPPSHSGSTPAPKTSVSTTHEPTSDTAKHHAVVPTSRPPLPSGGQVTLRPNPTRSFPGPVPSRHDPHPQQHNSEVTLVFEILGALAGVIFFLSIARCLYSYNRTPRHDRITSIIHRHQLQREMEELERHPPERRPSLVEPPPPYIPPPPSYINESTPLSNRESASYGEDPFQPNG